MRKDQSPYDPASSEQNGRDQQQLTRQYNKVKIKNGHIEHTFVSARTTFLACLPGRSPLRCATCAPGKREHEQRVLYSDHAP
jgi:hypothetical protein